MRRLPLADALRVRTPCTAGWDTMAPASDRTRHCAACDKAVVDVAKLTHDEAEALVAARDRGASVCVHLHVRTDDGAILLADGHALPSPSSPYGPSLSERAKVIVAAASAVALAACATTPEPQVPALVPVVLAPPPSPPPSLPAPPPPVEEPPPAIASVDPPAEPPQPVPPQRAKSAATKQSAPQAPIKGHKPPTYDIVDGGI